MNKSQRRAFARICYFAFFTISTVASGVNWDEWFMDALTEPERDELANLGTRTRNLANRWRAFAWKLEGRR